MLKMLDFYLMLPFAFIGLWNTTMFVIDTCEKIVERRETKKYYEEKIKEFFDDREK